MILKRKYNHRIFSYSLLIMMMFCCQLLTAQIQADTNIYHLETSEGNSYQGKIIEQDSQKVVFQTVKLGAINVMRKDIKTLYIIDNKKIKNGKYWMDNPQSTRYFFSPNGYGLKGGEGYYQNVWVLVNSFAVGITKNISIGGGVVPLFFFGGGPTPIWVTAKISLPIEKHKVAFGAGVLAGTVIGEENTGFGIFYGIGTIGSKDNNISLGLGYGYAGTNWTKSPIINLNFMFRTGPKGYFISENYYISTGEGSLVLISAGGRLIIKQAGLDYGLWIPFYSDMDVFVAIPWLGITIPFGNKNKK